MDNSKIIDIIDGVETDNGDVSQALEKASDALAFGQTLWEVFKLQGFVPLDAVDVDYSLMEHVIDGLNGELAAVCLFLCEHSEVPKVLRANADSLDAQNPEGVVPHPVIAGFRRIADRIENTKIQVEKAKALVAQMKGASEKTDTGAVDTAG